MMDAGEEKIEWAEKTERRAMMSAEDHALVCSANDRRLNERFAVVYKGFSDGSKRMDRIEASISELGMSAVDQKARIEHIAKLQYDLAVHIERIDKSIASSAAEADNRMDRIDAGLQQNTAVTQEIKDVLDTAKGAFRMFDWIGSGLKWVLGLGAAALGFWVALKDFRIH